MRKPNLVKRFAAEEPYKFAHSAGWDAGNRSMRKAGRSKWNDDDWNAACAEFERLYPSSVKLPEEVKRAKA